VRALRRVATAVFLFLVSMPVTVVRGLVVIVVVVALALAFGFMVTSRWGRRQGRNVTPGGDTSTSTRAAGRL
jgi:hypothetical protein